MQRQVKPKKANDEEIFRQFEKTLSRYDIDLGSIRFLGKGDNGAAYDVGNGKVMKITLDQTEAESAKSIVGRKFENIHEIFAVLKLGDTGKYFILQENLTQLSKAEKSKLSKLFDAVTLEDAARMSNTWDGMIAASHKNVDEFENGDQKMHAQVERAYEALKAFHVDKMVAQLNEAGIRFFDFHPGNVMKRGNSFVLIDLGEGAEAPQVSIESIVERIVRSTLAIFKA